MRACLTSELYSNNTGGWCTRARCMYVRRERFFFFFSYAISLVHRSRVERKKRQWGCFFCFFFFYFFGDYVCMCESRILVVESLVIPRIKIWWSDRVIYEISADKLNNKGGMHTSRKRMAKLICYAMLTRFLMFEVRLVTMGVNNMTYLLFLFFLLLD